MLIGSSIRREGEAAARQLGLFVASRLLTLPGECYTNRSQSQCRGTLGLFAHQAHEAQQFVPAGIRHRAILDIALLPKRQMVAVARRIAWATPADRGPGKYVDYVRAMLVNDHR